MVLDDETLEQSDKQSNDEYLKDIDGMEESIIMASKEQLSW
jgi:hypothetical protein